ncbi:hypothetical protein [Microbacterium lacticum]
MMRRRRLDRYPVLGAAIATALILTGCATAGTTRDIPIIDGENESWSVTVSQPRFSDDERCTDDANIENAVLSADLPSSSLGVILVPGSSEQDARRIAECLQRTLISGEVTISAPVK